MNRAIKIVIAISVLVALWALNLAFEVFPRVSAQQQQAIETLSKPALSGELNGWTTALEMAERPEFAKRKNETCGANDDCFARVAADLPPMQQRARDAAPLIALQKTFYRFDHWAAPDTTNLLDGKIPAFQFNELLTAITTQAVSGEPQAAMHELCEFAQFSRSLTRGNSLIMLMVGDSYLTRAMRMMTELQNRYAVVPDAQCMQAVAPLDTDQQFCEAIKGEFMVTRQLINALEVGDAPTNPARGSRTNAWLSRLGINAKHTQALFAGALMQYCPQVRQQKFAQRCSWMEQALNPIGCELFQVGRANYSSYQNRLVDLQQKLALFRLSQFARSSEAQACAEHLDCGPEGTLAGLIHDTAKASISITLSQPRNGQPTL